MPNLYINVITPDRNDYLTPRLESDNLIDNAVDLIIAPFTAPANGLNVPRVRSTGNIIVYAGGILVASGAVNPGDVIATVPTKFRRRTLNGEDFILSAICLLAGSATLCVLTVRTLNDQIEIVYTEGSVLAAADLIYLDSITFFTDASCK